MHRHSILSTPFSSSHNHATRKLIALLCRTLLACTLLLSCSACSESPEQTIREYSAEADQFINKHQYAEAITCLNKLRALDPGNPNLDFRLGVAYKLNGQFLQAIYAFREHQAQHPDSPDALLNILQLQLMLYDIQGAEKTWNRLKLFPPSTQNFITHGDLLASKQQFDQALEAYKKALGIEKANQTALARLAVLLEGLHREKEAASYYGLLEAQHPGKPEILLQMGNYWLTKGEAKQADAFLRQAVNQDPENQSLNLKLAELYLTVGEYDRAVEVYQRLLDHKPQNRFYKKMLWESMLMGKQSQELAKLLAGLSAAENEDVDFLLLKGKYYMITGNYLTAASQFELALEKEPRLPLAQYLLGLSYLASGQNFLGQKCLLKALTLNPHFTAAELALADCYYKTGEYAMALEHVRRIQEKEPENYRAFLIAGNILLAKQQYETALEAYRKAHLLNRSIPAPRFYSGIILNRMKKNDQALALHRSLLKEYPLLADTTFVYTSELLDQDQYTAALEYLENTATAFPENPYVPYIAGLIHHLKGKSEEADKAFRRALMIVPDMKEAYLQLFNVYRNKQGELQKILAEATTRIQNFEEAEILLAAIYKAENRPLQAIQLLKEALSRNPHSPILANNLACLYLEHQPDNIAETMRLASLAYDALPDNAAVADTLGWTFHKKGMNIRAEWLLEEAAGLEPNNAQILYHLAMVQTRTDKKDLARQNLVEAGKNCKSNKLAEKIEQGLLMLEQEETPDTPENNFGTVNAIDDMHRQDSPL